MPIRHMFAIIYSLSGAFLVALGVLTLLMLANARSLNQAETRFDSYQLADELRQSSAEMGRNVTQAAQGTQEIASNITSVARAVQDASAGAQQSQSAAAELARMAAELQQLVGQFQVEGRREPAMVAAAPPSRARSNRVAALV